MAEVIGVKLNDLTENTSPQQTDYIPIVSGAAQMQKVTIANIAAKGPPGEQGPKGDKGDTGPQGIKGDKGDKGDTGSQGPQGIQGIEGPQGAQGMQGEKGADGLTTSIQLDGVTHEQSGGVIALPDRIPPNLYSPATNFKNNWRKLNANALAGLSNLRVACCDNGVYKGRFLMIGNMGASTHFLTSDDGVNWTKQYERPTEALKYITYQGGYFFAWGSSSSEKAFYSADGVSYSEIVTFSTGIKGIYYLGTQGYVYVTDSEARYTANHESWEPVVFPETIGSFMSVQCVKTVTGSGLETMEIDSLYFFTYDNKCYTVDTLSPLTASISLYAPPENMQVEKVCMKSEKVLENGGFWGTWPSRRVVCVLLGSRPEIIGLADVAYYSYDLQNWEKVKTAKPYGDDGAYSLYVLDDVLLSNGVFFGTFLGAGEALNFISPDGISWTDTGLSIDEQAVSVAYSNLRGVYVRTNAGGAYIHYENTSSEIADIAASVAQVLNAIIGGE